MFDRKDMELILKEYEGFGGNLQLDLIDDELSVSISPKYSNIILHENFMVIDKYDRKNYYIVPYDKIVRINSY